MNHIHFTAKLHNGVTRTIVRQGSTVVVSVQTSLVSLCRYTIAPSELGHVEVAIALARSGRFVGQAKVAVLKRPDGHHVHVTADHDPGPRVSLVTVTRGRREHLIALHGAELEALSRAVSDATIARAA